MITAAGTNLQYAGGTKPKTGLWEKLFWGFNMLFNLKVNVNIIQLR